MLILASASQSRKTLLENAKIKFIQIPTGFDESIIKEENIKELALKLSISKAQDLFNKYKGEKLNALNKL